MGQPRIRPCGHRLFKRDCASCKALKEKWYGKLKSSGFVDIEYGHDNARFLAHVPDAAAPGSDQAQSYYERVWQVFHAWTSSGRSRRDCRVAELFAGQAADTGTVRGIARTLRAEGLSPRGFAEIIGTLREIDAAARAVSDESPTDSLVYLQIRNKAA